MKIEGGKRMVVSSIVLSGCGEGEYGWLSFDVMIIGVYFW